MKEIFPAGRAMVANEVVGTSQGFRIARAMSWSTSILAIVVGVLGVMNTMMMTVFERTQEICVLLAIGWKRSRIMRMILWESALLGLLGGIAGTIFGVLGVQLLVRTPAMRGLLEPDLSARLLGRPWPSQSWSASSVDSIPPGAVPVLPRARAARLTHPRAREPRIVSIPMNPSRWIPLTVTAAVLSLAFNPFVACRR